MLATCQPGFERHLAAELASQGVPTPEHGNGWAGGEAPPGMPGDLAFPHCLLPDAREIHAATVNSLARAAIDHFAGALGDERVEVAWPCVWTAAAGTPGLARRAALVEKEFHRLLKRRFARVARLAERDPPSGLGPVRGLFVVLVDFQRAFVSRTAVLGGQRRMADDPAAPSRSYLKLEEAYGLLGAEPAAGQVVVDLGAAPGGWSYSAAKRGASVLAVDNGPLKGGARDHPLITHRRADAFGFQPETRGGCDWMLCDLVAEPHHVLRHLVQPWLARRWCRNFVVNLKFGRTDPVALLAELRSPASPLVAHAAWFRLRHLYHDREEFTIVGRL